MKTAVAGEDDLPATCPACGSRGMPRRLSGLPCRDPWHGESLLCWARSRGYAGIVKLMEQAREKRGADWGTDWKEGPRRDQRS